MSLFAAIFFALAAVGQQHSAYKQHDRLNLRPALIIRLLKDKIWVTATLCSVVGYVFQASALSKGSLTVVQPILVLGLVFAMIIAAAWRHRGLHKIEWFGSLMVTGGLAVFLTVSQPKLGSANARFLAWLLIIIISLFLITVLTAISIFLKNQLKSLLQATVAGIFNGLTAVFLKSLSVKASVNWHLYKSLTKEFFILLTTWQSYAIAISYVGVLIFVQSAFQAGTISWSLPALTVANPVASLAMGIFGFHETIRTDPIFDFLYILLLTLIIIGVVALAKSDLMQPIVSKSNNDQTGANKLH
jgi:drug/metabolite transporter (DMT)-like permease